MAIDINITEKKYGFINPENGQEMSPEEFAKKYPRVGFGKLALEAKSEAGTAGGNKSVEI